MKNLFRLKNHFCCFYFETCLYRRHFLLHNILLFYRLFFRFHQLGRKLHWVFTIFLAVSTIALAITLIRTITFFESKITLWEETYSTIETEVDKQEDTIQKLKSENNSLSSALESAKKSASIAQENYQDEIAHSAKLTQIIQEMNQTLDYVVFVPIDGKKKYHSYNCSVWKSWEGSFYAFNVENARYNGYKSCSKCQ